MKRVATAVVLVPLVLAALFLAPTWLFAALVCAVALLAMHEYLGLAQEHGAIPFRRVSLFAVLVIFITRTAPLVIYDKLMNSGLSSGAGVNMAEHPHIVAAQKIFGVFWAGLWALPFLLLIWGMRRSNLRDALPGAAASVFGLFYVAAPLMGMVLMRWAPMGACYILYLFLVVWCGDIAAYYVGSAIGRHRLAPNISPGKSWEGAAASAVFSVIIGSVILTHLNEIDGAFASFGWAHHHSVLSADTHPVSLWMAALCSLGINVAAQLGDLVESMMKRGAGVKDSGTLLPGHGGVLDRIDALLFAIPVLWYYSIFHILTP